MIKKSQPKSVSKPAIIKKKSQKGWFCNIIRSDNYKNTTLERFFVPMLCL